jgi:transcriptional regulator with GAF, ATPase, and Fis domain
VATLIVKAPDGTERRVSLSRRITSIGRDPENDVAVADAALPPTALHLHFDGRDWDAAAHDGAAMTVNGRSRGTWRLGPGDRIRVGATELLFDPTPRPPVPPPPGPVVDLRTAREALIRFSERLLAATDLARLLDELLDALVEVTQADKGFLILLQDGEMTVRAARNVARETIEGAVSRVSDTIVRKVVETGRPLVVADALHDTEWSGSSSVVNLKLCSVMCAPLKQKGEVFGVIYLGNDNVVSLFDQRALDLLTVFTAQASLLVQNGLLLDSLRRENVALREAVTTRQYGDLVGSGASMREVFRRIEKVASTDISVLVTGETGTGKEVVAREIHRRSPRSGGPFVAVNCGAIPEALLESELFGHVKGAFTGATASRRGRFALADGGTIFLDEIGTLALPVQAKLLRVLQEREFEPVGSERTEAADLRVIAATNRDLRAMVAEGRFQEDLFYRLSVIPIELPPLRERREDIPLLVEHFVRKHSQRVGRRIDDVSASALERLSGYHWPGNVRELENAIERAVVLTAGAVIDAASISMIEAPPGPAAGGLPSARLHENVEWAEQESVRRALRQANGVKKDAAEILGISQRALSYYLAKYKIG